MLCRATLLQKEHGDDDSPKHCVKTCETLELQFMTKLLMEQSCSAEACSHNTAGSAISGPFASAVL